VSSTVWSEENFNFFVHLVRLHSNELFFFKNSDHLDAFFYFGYFWSKSGQSIGMKLMNIKVVKTDNSPISFLSAALRGTVGYWISGLILWLGFIWILIDKDKQGWHDKIFNTYVVRS
jgi:uncharacterized RDD family membrane protein YckC